MKTLISSVPLLSIPNEKNYSIVEIEKMFQGDFQVDKINSNTLKVKISGRNSFRLKISKNITFYKISPVFFQAYFLITFIPFVLSIISLIFSSIFGLIFSELNFMGVLLVVLGLVISLAFCQLPEIIYFSALANKHTDFIDVILKEIKMSR